MRRYDFVKLSKCSDWVYGLDDGRIEFDSWQGRDIFLQTGSETQPPILWVSERFSVG
jgi:hypothetical protein